MIHINKRIDLTSKRFGNLTVIKLSDVKAKNGTRHWECLCDCGKTTYVLGTSLRAGYYKSCGCMRNKRRDKGLSEHIKSDRIKGTRKSALKSKLHKGNSSGHKGVTWLKDRKKYRAYIGYKGKQIHLGHFDNIDDAIKARKSAEIKYYSPILDDNSND